MSHYHITNRPKLLGDDASAVTDAQEGAKESTPLLQEPVVKYGIRGAAIFHGYKRTGSVLWALLYGACASVSPVVTGAVVVAQGFGQKKGS